MTKLSSAFERKPSPLSVSVFLHGLLILIFLLLQLYRPKTTQKVNFEVIDFPKAAPNNLTLQPIQKIQPPPPNETRRKVFGLRRDAITATQSTQAPVEIKQGNTVAKDPDQLTLEKEDADSLPIPTEDYLVSSMPSLKSEFRIPYPEEAKKAGVEGPVVMELLIDETGVVRQVNVVTGPGYGLNEAAVEAAKKFRFSPAMMDQKPVAVKIRYTYRFVLQNR